MMALRYLARRAFQQRALLVPRVPPSAGSRPVSTRGRGSSPPEGLRTNESKAGAAAAASKGNTEPELLGSQKLDKVGFASSIYKAASKDRATDFCVGLVCLMGSASFGAAVAFLRNYYATRNEKTITLEVEVI